jgi:3-dehydroquinate dehydratase-1
LPRLILPFILIMVVKFNKTVFRTDSEEVTIGAVPRVVGTVSSLARKSLPRRGVTTCDLVEVRLDLTGRPARWLHRCAAIQDAGWPVLLTVRLATEGGGWKGADEQRWDIFEQGLGELAGADVEWRSELARPVAKLAKKLRKVCVVSYHDFEKTPAKKYLEEVIAQAQEVASIVKISTRLKSRKDEEVLRSLLAAKWKKPLCVIGMGAAWAHTRVEFTKLGSCLTYGYLNKPTAPGQMSAALLTKKLKQFAG